MQHTTLKRRLLAFYRCIKIVNPMQNNDFTTHHSGIEGNFICRIVELVRMGVSTV